MTRLSTFDACAVQCGAIALALLATALPAAAADDPCTPRLKPREQHLLDAAHRGIDNLRDYLFVRRAILQLDIRDAADWVGRIDRLRRNAWRRWPPAPPRRACR